MRFHMGAGCSATVVLLLAASACAVPDDDLHRVPGPGSTSAENPRRLTFNQAPDVVRGFDGTGRRVVYRTTDLAGVGDGVRLVSVSLSGDSVREEAGLYTAALFSPPGTLVMQPGRRVYTVWRPGIEGVESCAGCPSPPAAVSMTIFRLEPADGPALSSLPNRSVALPTARSASNCDHRVRITPAEREIRERGTNPYGPAVPADGDTAYYSDGERVWGFHLERPRDPPWPVGAGAFPAVSPDGSLLAAAIPEAADSAISQCLAGLCPCVQETVEFAVTGWRIRLYDLADGTDRDLGPGLEPVFHPLDRRLLVRRPDQLYWVDISSDAADSIPGTAGAFAPALSPDGSAVGFSASPAGNPDVFLLEIDGAGAP